MTRRSFIPALALLAIALVASFALVVSSGAAKSGKTETLRLFDKNTSVTLIQASGKKITKEPYPQPAAGDSLIATALDYVGTHKKHDKSPIGSSRVVCKFTSTPAPDCTSNVAIEGSLLVFDGDPGTLVGGAGKYLGASGKVLSNKTIGETNDSDVVVQLKLK